MPKDTKIGMNLTYLFVLFFIENFEAGESTLLHAFFCLRSPFHGSNGEDSLTRPKSDPLLALLSGFSVVQISLINDILDRLYHDLFDRLKPLFDVTFGKHRVNNLDILNALALR